MYQVIYIFVRIELGQAGSYQIAQKDSGTLFQLRHPKPGCLVLDVSRVVLSQLCFSAATESESLKKKLQYPDTDGH